MGLGDFLSSPIPQSAHEGKESEQNSGPLRTDYTTHSLRMEILIAMTAATLLTTMIDHTVRRLIRPTDEPPKRTERRHRKEDE
jgi:hypothetical protein